MFKQSIVVALAVVWCVPVLAKGDVRAGEQKAAMCVACHGVSGHSSSPLYPSLAGQSEAYLSHALHAYKTGERHGGQAEIMKAYVAGLSDTDIDNLSAYYAKQKARQ